METRCCKIVCFLIVISAIFSPFYCGVLSRNRLSEADLAEWSGYNIKEPEGPGTYSFGFDVEEPDTGNIQFRTEERHFNGTITGSYGFMSPDGYIHIVHYVADQLGYRARIEDGGRLKSSNGRFHQNSDRSHQSPEMRAALKSIRTHHPSNKVYDQHVRPYDQNQHYQEIAPVRNNIQEIEDDEFYNYYYVPSNQIIN